MILREWKGTTPVLMVLKGKEHRDLSGWRSVLAVLAEEVVACGKTIPPTFLKNGDNGHRTIPIRGVFLNVNLCNDDMVARVKVLARLVGGTCTVTYTRKGVAGFSDAAFGEGSSLAPTGSSSRLFTEVEVADLLRVDEACVRDLVEQRRIPHIRVKEGVARFDPDAVLAALYVQPA